MNIKAFKVPICLLLFNLILSIPQFEWNKSIGWVRLLLIPVLLFVLFDLLGKIGRKRLQFVIKMSWSILGLLLLFVFQIFLIPSEALEMHLSGCIKFISWILLYLCSLATITEYTAPQFAKGVTFILFLNFLGIVLQYPFLILASSKSFFDVIASYGDTTLDKSIHGLFAAANEDANGMITLLPFCLYFVEKTTALKKWLLRLLILLYIPIILLFNGTRSALFAGFPLISLLFYLKFSVIRLVRIAPFLLGAVALLVANTRSFAEQAFKSESLQNGNFGWRVLRLWIPATRYTFEHSPILGFGSRGWDYVCILNNIVLSQTGQVTSVFDTTPPHNIYIWIYVSWGIFGFLMYLSFLALLLKESFLLCLSKRAEVSKLGKATFCSMVAYCIWGGISNSHFESGWIILFSLGILTAALKSMELSFKPVLQPSYS
jgi:O-antigen ligase